MPIRKWFLFPLSVMVLLMGCGSGSGVDVSEYFGKTREEIQAMLGEPGGPYEPTGKQAEMFQKLKEMGHDPLKEAHSNREIHYWKDTQQLPWPLLELHLRFSQAGYCYQVSGITTGFDTPEKLLASIGLGKLEKKVVGRNKLGYDYEMPPYEQAQVRRPIVHVQDYTRFNVYDKEATEP